MQITIRVKDNGGEGGVAGRPEQMAVRCGSESIPLAGIWRYAIGYDTRLLPWGPLSPDNSSHPTVLYNAMIHPYLSFPIQGVIWYQGCANVGRATQYEPLFQALIHDWRKQFGRPDLPFYFVQLANYLERRDLQPDSEWALLREAQSRALVLPNTGMVTNIDLFSRLTSIPRTSRPWPVVLQPLPCATPTAARWSAVLPLTRTTR